jgi:hypothetical protein
MRAGRNMTTNDPNKEGRPMKHITMTAFAAGLGLTGMAQAQDR